MNRSRILPAAACWVILSLLCARATPSSRQFDSERAYRDLVKQCEFGPRVPGTKEHELCANWLAAELEACADSVVRQQFTAEVKGTRLPLTNIIATFSPNAAGHILLCAHWDTRPMADQDPDPKNRAKPVPGANDGASGVAVLLELARALKSAPPQQKVTIVLFDGEDYGREIQDMLLGSRHFAEHYQCPPPDWAVLLDMVGDRDLRLPQEGYSRRRAPSVVDRIWGAAQRAGCEAFVREVGTSVLDDHIPLLARGIPCIDIIDFEYPYWHTVSDTPDKCAPASLGEVGRALLKAIAENEEAASRAGASRSSRR